MHVSGGAFTSGKAGLLLLHLLTNGKRLHMLLISMPSTPKHLAVGLQCIAGLRRMKTGKTLLKEHMLLGLCNSSVVTG